MKKFKYIFIALIGFAIFTINVDAASVSLKKNYSTITKGGYVTVIATVSSESPIVSIEGTLSCSGAGANSTVNMAFDDMSNSLYSKSFSTTVRSTSTGTITCNASGVRITSMASANWQYLGNQSTTINVTPPRTYSSNNYLSGLSIDGYSLSPIFNKDTLEYSIEVPNEVRKIKINATKEDNTASITGDGEKDLIEGVNRLEVIVTAENGATKTYIINVTVKELDPIIVKVDNKEYTVIRKKEQLTVPSTFTETTVKINEFDVPALENKKLGYILVGLKDTTGNIQLYIYDVKTNNYTLYKEYKSKSSTIYILSDESKIPNGYTKSKVKINDSSVIAYKLTNDSKYYLLYGINVETGKKSLYVYDSVEETIQRYNDDEVLKENNEMEAIYQYIIISLGCLLIITYLVFLINLINNSKKKKKIIKKKMSKKRVKDETVQINSDEVAESKDEKEVNDKD